MSMQSISYTKGGHHASASIIGTDDGRYQGAVVLSHDSVDNDIPTEHHIVPVLSDTQDEAFDEAKALAHRLLANLQ